MNAALESESILLAALVLVVIFALLGKPATLRMLRQENSLLRSERGDAYRRVADLEGLLAEWSGRAEWARQNSIRSPVNQLEAVNDNAVTFSRRPVMNRGEAAVFYAAQEALCRRALKKWHVFPQVSLGEFIGAHSYAEQRERRAHQSINSKRCDLLIADSKGLPVVVIECQGSGHYQGTSEQRDAVKRAAVERAGIRFIEIANGTHPEEIVRTILAQL